jgi:glycosyltransferase involved in cell wall biosynthesis
MQYFEVLARVAPALDIEQQALLDSGYLISKYAGRPAMPAALRGFLGRALAFALRRAPDLWWVEKELWPWVPAAVERALLRRRPYVLDLDDAIFHNYDLHPSPTVRRLYADKIDRLMAGAALVVAGNDYLAARGRAAGARWVEILPTVVDLDRYPGAPGRDAAADAHAPVAIGWIGSPATAHYLLSLREPLARLARERPVRFVVIGSAGVELPGVEVVTVPWSQASEVESIARLDIGVMPLFDSPWEHGKCGYKLIQYMACGLPVVASPVGVNRQIVSDDVNGYLASDTEGWYAALERLAANAPLRSRLGDAGRRRVEAEYSLQVTAPRLAAWLAAAACRGMH